MITKKAKQEAQDNSLLSRFLRYVRVNTQASFTSDTYPSTPGQWNLLKMLQQELLDLGAGSVNLNADGYLTATIPATVQKAGLPTVAFFAHVDTSPEFCGASVKPVLHRNYDGSIIRFPDNSKLLIDPSLDLELKDAVGKDIVTASGSTLLGADDKSGIAIIMTMAEQLLKNPGIEHGPIRVCFTPDEEIGHGVDKLNLKELGANVAYTIDGHLPGEICWETFSADAATVTIEGVSTHPGEANAKGMVNAVHLAARFLMSLPREHCCPETTSGGEDSSIQTA